MRRIVHGWVFDNRGRILMQRIAATRERHPLRWGSSVAGHCLDREPSARAIVRKACAELGLDYLDGVEWRERLRHTTAEDGTVRVLYHALWNGSRDELQLDRAQIEQIAWCHTIAVRAALRVVPEQFTPAFRGLWVAWERQGATIAILPNAP